MRFVCVLLCLVAGLCTAGPDRTSGLVFADLNGVPRRPLDPADKLASVLIFYWQDCPICNNYAPALNRMAASHDRFAWFLVQVDPDLTPAAARDHARQFDLRPPVLLDPKHQLVTLAKASVTPEAVVVGKSGQILYRGRIDNRYAALGKKRAAATEHDLLEALEAIAAGKPVKRSETKAIGCLIQ